MTLLSLVEALELEKFSANPDLSGEVTGGYAGDLLSDVLARGEPGMIWVTLQTHPNVAAVASLKELSAVILVGGRRPEERTMEKAEEEGLILLGSPLSTFELAGRIYELGVRAA